MTITEVVQMQGHLIDSGALSRALDDILESGADYEIQDLVFGKTKNDESRARILISHEDDTALNDLLVRLQNHGVNPVETSDAEMVPAPMDGVFPKDSTRARTSRPSSGSPGSGFRYRIPRWTAAWSSATVT